MLTKLGFLGIILRPPPHLSFLSLVSPGFVVVVGGNLAVAARLFKPQQQHTHFQRINHSGRREGPAFCGSGVRRLAQNRPQKQQQHRGSSLKTLSRIIITKKKRATKAA